MKSLILDPLSRSTIALRKRLILSGVFFLLLLPGIARGQDSEITVSAPSGGGCQLWVDMNPTGNTATSVGTLQRCKKINAADATFDVDIVVYNAPAYQKLFVTLVFDSAYVQFVSASVSFNLFRNGGTACNPNPLINFTGNSLTLYQFTTVGHGGSGNGTLARITFKGKAPYGQSGFDVTSAELDSGAGSTCFNGVWAAIPGVAFGSAIGQAYIDPTDVIGCWTVTSTADTPDASPGDGICDVDPTPGIVVSTLRAAIQEANAIGGANRISFRVPNQNRMVPTVPIACPDLPALTDASGGTTLDGTTHSGVVLDAFGGTTDGLRLNSNNNTIKALTVMRAAASGIKITSTSGNKVLGCIIGTNPIGVGDRRNTDHGISITSGTNNEIGGVNAGEGNLICSNTNFNRAGILIAGGSGNLVRGNTIGLDATGARQPNFWGIMISSSNGNTIGGSVIAARNIISGNNNSGIRLSAGAANNVIQGNLVGTDPTGTIARFNGAGGIYLDYAQNTTIGGSTGTVGAPPGNIVSGNQSNGIYVRLSISTGNIIKGNKVGLDINGNVLANSTNGIQLDGAANTTIGGNTAADRNAISGNKFVGVYILNSATGNQVKGNYVGLDEAGFLSRPNETHGVAIFNSTGNTIGGSTAIPGTPPGNVISANLFEGVYIPSTTGQGSNTVSGNVIGLDANGFEAGNQMQGVNTVDSPNNTIGGATNNERNVISGNAKEGVYIWGGSGNQVLRNFIGTTLDGTASRPNAYAGVRVQESPTAAALEQNLKMLGTATQTPSSGGILIAAGGNVIADGIISGNAGNGVEFIGEAADANSVLRVGIGTNFARNAPLPNGGHGVSISGGADYNLIGTPGNGNTISGNTGNGVDIQDASTTGNLVRGNIIGLDGTGELAMPNNNGVRIHLGAQFNQVGGPLGGQGNVISGNNVSGVEIIDADTDHNNVQLNTIGTDIGRDDPMPNHASGVHIRDEAERNTVVDNAIEANIPHGVHVEGTNVGLTSRNKILSNFIGSSSLPNQQDGVHIGPFAPLNQVTLNAIGNNAGDGVEITGEESDGNVVFGNSVIGEGGNGVRISASADDNVVGGFIPLSRNLIQGNAQDGISIVSGTGNGLYENTISQNGQLGIDLNDDGVSVNDAAPDGDGGANNLQNFPIFSSATAGAGAITAIGTLTSAPNRVYRVEFFSNNACDPSGSGEGTTFLDFRFVTTNGAGTANINAVVAGPIGAFMTATATDTLLHDTSEFSPCQQVTAGAGTPADLAVTIATDFDTIAVTDTLVYHVVGTNHGLGNATGVQIVNTLPGGLTFVSSVASQGTCAGTSTVTCTVGSLAAGASVTVTIRVVPIIAGTIVDLAQISGNESDPDVTNNTANESTVVTSPLTGTGPLPVRIDKAMWLGQNIPNPFNPSTRIPFSIPSTAVVKLSIYDVRGQLVRVLVDGTRGAGEQTVSWDGKDRNGMTVSTGTYFYVLQTPWGRSSQRMVLLK